MEELKEGEDINTPSLSAGLYMEHLVWRFVMRSRVAGVASGRGQRNLSEGGKKRKEKKKSNM